MNTAQLELEIENIANTHAFRGQRARARHQWWFERMRQIVDRAFDWEPAPEARPEQTWFLDASTKLASFSVSGNAGAK